MSLSKNRRQVLSAIGDFVLGVLRVAEKLGQSKDDSSSHLLGQLRPPQGFVLFGDQASSLDPAPFAHPENKHQWFMNLTWACILTASQVCG